MTLKAPKTKLLLNFLLTAVMVLNFGCQNEELQPEVQTTNKINFISLSEFSNQVNHNQESYEKLQSFFDRNQVDITTQSRTTIDETSDITVLTDVITSIEEDDFISYTFKVIVASENSKFYNLIVSVDEVQNIIDSKFLEYTPTVNWLADTSQPFTGYIKLIDNDFLDIDNIFAARVTQWCITSVHGEWECNHGNNHAPGEGTLCDEWTYVITPIYGGCPSSVVPEEGFYVGDYEDPIQQGGGGGSVGTPTIPTIPCEGSSDETDANGNCFDEDILTIENCIGTSLPSTLNSLQIATIANFIDTNGCEGNQAFVEAAIEALEDGIDFDTYLRLVIGMNKECQAIKVFQSISKIRDDSEFAQNIWNHFFVLSSNNKLILLDEDLGANVGAFVDIELQDGIELEGGTILNDVVMLQFNDSHLNTATTLGFVITFYRELVHAYMVSLYHNDTLLTEYPSYTALKTAMDNLLSDTDNSDYIEAYKQESHNIYTDFIDDIADAIVEYCEYNNINGVDEVYAKKLVWGTLNGNDIFTNSLTGAQQIEAQTLLAYENSNTGSKKGTKTCN